MVASGSPTRLLRERIAARVEHFGGGRIWVADKPGQERPSENRIREAVSLPDVELFVVSCPKDVTMYEDAIKTSGNAERIELREVTELVQEALVASPELLRA